MNEAIQLLLKMQENYSPLEQSHSRLHLDIFNNSFSDLQNHEDNNLEQRTLHIDIAEQKPNNCEILIKQELTESVQVDVKSSSFQLYVKEDQRNNIQLNHLSEQVNKKEQQFSEKINQHIKSYHKDQIEQEHIQKIKLIYSCSFLNSQKISLSQIKKLKSFLFIPKHGEVLVRWGNQKFGTQHTVISALERLQYMQNSECSQLTVKLKQNLKYLLVLCLCLITIKVIV